MATDDNDDDAKDPIFCIGYAHSTGAWSSMSYVLLASGTRLLQGHRVGRGAGQRPDRDELEENQNLWPGT